MENQGKKWRDFKKGYVQLVPNSILGLEGAVGDALKNENSKTMQKMLRLEDTFNTKLSQYKNKYKLYLEEIMLRQTGNISKLKNKIVKDNNGNKYFITNTGLKRKFTPDSWSNKGGDCSDPVSTLNNKELNSITSGLNMQPMEECRSGGYLATDGTSTAWVDEYGEKHFFDNPNNMHSSCPKTAKTISNSLFSAIKRGSDYTSQDACETGSISSDKWSEIENLNSQLLSIINEMRNEVNKYKGIDKDIEDDITETKKKLIIEAGNLNKKRREIRKLLGESDALDAIVKNRRIDIISSNYQKAAIILGSAILLGGIYKLVKM